MEKKFKFEFCQIDGVTECTISKRRMIFGIIPYGWDIVLRTKKYKEVSNFVAQFYS